MASLEYWYIPLVILLFTTYIKGSTYGFTKPTKAVLVFSIVSSLSCTKPCAMPVLAKPLEGCIISSLDRAIVLAAPLTYRLSGKAMDRHP